MTTTDYVQHENARLIAWKRRTAAIPEAARAPGTYSREGAFATQPLDVCLPREFAKYNLLPEVRAGALALFRELNIPWHDSVDRGPSNHLRDSQVQCVNALYPMVREPQRTVTAFGGDLDIAEVLMIEPGRYLTFEYIGGTDYFGEGRGLPRQRGTRCTSVDAAFEYRTSKGTTELALVEWKYTENYPRPRKVDPRKDAVRRTRYQVDFSDPEGAINSCLSPFDALLDEPFYQLLRQQLLAHRLERDPLVAAERVRVLNVLSPSNSAYQRCLHRLAESGIGETVDRAWSELLLQPDRFVKVDPIAFLAGDVTYAHYLDRYGDH